MLALLPLLPFLALPALGIHLPTPQEALSAADALLHPGSGSGSGSGSIKSAHPYPDTILSPGNDMELSSVKDDYVRITSARHPKHSVRIKETTGWCDPGVRSYTG